MMHVLILAGGLGTRLRSVVSDRPKALADVGGKPFLEYQVERLRDQGFTRFVFCVGYLADQVRAYFGDGSPWGVRIDYAVEETLLGTAGAIRNAAPLLDGPFAVLNGDSFLDVDLRALVRAHEEHRAKEPAGATLAAVRVPDVSAFGALELDAGQRVVGFREKGPGGPGLVNGGVYVIEPAVLEVIPPGRAVSLEREVFPRLPAHGLALYAFPVDGFFVDIGTPEGYHRFQHYLSA